MTKLRRIALFTLLFLSITTGALVIKYSKDVAERSKLNSYIDIAINDYKEQKTPYIDLTSINYFSWDRLYIFGPYSNCEYIIETLDAPYFWPECSASGIEYYESILLFVFKKNGFIMKSTRYYSVDMREINHAGYPYEDAHFILDEKARMIWAVDK